MLKAAKLGSRFSIWDLLVLTAAIAMMLALPFSAMEVLFIGAVLIVEIGVLLIIPLWIIYSRRSEAVDGGERIIGQLLLRIFAVAVFVAVFGMVAITCRQPGLV